MMIYFNLADYIRYKIDHKRVLYYWLKSFLQTLLSSMRAMPMFYLIYREKYYY